MSTCKNCGAQLPENAVFCSTCGTPANAQQAQPGANGASGQQTQSGVNGAFGQQTQPGANGAFGQQAQPGVNGAFGQQAQPGVNGAFGQQAQSGANGAFGQPQQPGMNAAPGQGMQPNPNMAYGQQMYQTPYPSGQPSGAYGYPNADLQKSKHNKKVGIIAAVIILVAIIAVIGVLVFKIFSGSRGYESAVKQYVKGIQNHDLQELTQAFPKELREDISESYLFWYSDEDEFWEEFDEYLELRCGDHVKITYRIDEAEAFDREDIEDLEEDLEYYYDYECKISEAYGLEITLVCKGSEDTYEDSMDLVVAKIGGHWYAVDE